MEDLPIVAFDFDGTMTVTDSFTAFLRWRTPAWLWALGGIRLIPATLASLVHRDRGRIKLFSDCLGQGGNRIRQRIDRRAVPVEQRVGAAEHIVGSFTIIGVVGGGHRLSAAIAGACSGRVTGLRSHDRGRT